MAGAVLAVAGPGAGGRAPTPSTPPAQVCMWVGWGMEGHCSQRRVPKRRQYNEYRPLIVDSYTLVYMSSTTPSLPSHGVCRQHTHPQSPAATPPGASPAELPGHPLPEAVRLRGQYVLEAAVQPPRPAERRGRRYELSARRHPPRPGRYRALRPRRRPPGRRWDQRGAGRRRRWG